MTSKWLHYGYVSLLAIWPGLAVTSLQFVPAAQEVWVARLPGALLFIGCLVLLAGVAMYLSFITEVMPFPSAAIQAWLTVLLLPAYFIVSWLTTDQTIWEMILTGFMVECAIVLVTIGLLVIQKVSLGNWNTYAVVVLLGTVSLLMSAMVPLLIKLAAGDVWVYVVTTATVLSGAVQNIGYYQQPARPKLPAELFILLGVFVLITVPLVTAAVRGALA